jgi:3-hydroxyisobutyrate dehydrogenase-like beta-hydroxyacid dehydrogenase
MDRGFAALGRMGLNMATRLVRRGGHHVVAFDRSTEATMPGHGSVEAERLMASGKRWDEL